MITHDGYLENILDLSLTNNRESHSGEYQNLKFIPTQTQIKIIFWNGFTKNILMIAIKELSSYLDGEKNYREKFKIFS